MLSHCHNAQIGSLLFLLFNLSMHQSIFKMCKQCYTALPCILLHLLHQNLCLPLLTICLNKHLSTYQHYFAMFINSTAFICLLCIFQPHKLNRFRLLAIQIFIMYNYNIIVLISATLLFFPAPYNFYLFQMFFALLSSLSCISSA